MMLALRTRRAERRTIARLTEAGANTAERAILLEEGGKVSAFVYKRLGRAGALVPAGNDRYYLNQAAYDAFRGRRRTRGLIVLAALLGIIAVLYFSGVIT